MHAHSQIYQKRFGTHLNTMLRDSGLFGAFRSFSGFPGLHAKLLYHLAFSGAFLRLRLGPARAFFLCFSSVLGCFLVFSALPSYFCCCSSPAQNCSSIWLFRVPFCGPVSALLGPFSCVFLVFLVFFGAFPSYPPVCRFYSSRAQNCSRIWLFRVPFGGPVSGVLGAFWRVCPAFFGVFWAFPPCPPIFRFYSSRARFGC